MFAGMFRRILVAGAAAVGLGMGAAAMRPGDRPAPAAAAGGSVGSGFVVARGAVVTTAHLARRCAGRLHAADGSTWRMQASDDALDLGLLTPVDGGVTASPLPLSAARHLRPGEPVLLLGYPHGAGRPQVSPGRIAGEALTLRPADGRVAVLRLADAGGHPVPPRWRDGVAWAGGAAGGLRWALLVDAGSVPGASGGPAVDGAGGVVGVVFAGYPDGPTLLVPLADLTGFLGRQGVVPDFVAPPAAADWPAARAAAARAMLRLSC